MKSYALGFGVWASDWGLGSGRRSRHFVCAAGQPLGPEGVSKFGERLGQGAKSKKSAELRRDGEE